MSFKRKPEDVDVNSPELFKKAKFKQSTEETENKNIEPTTEKNLEQESSSSTSNCQTQDQVVDDTVQKRNITFFHTAESPLSQWYHAEFTVEGVEYMCSEQFMMHQKAGTCQYQCHDTDSYYKIMISYHIH